jgi:signal transduction histidine kinase
MAVVTGAGLAVAAVVALRTARRISSRAGGAGGGWAPWLALITGLAMSTFAVRAVSYVGAGQSQAEVERRERSEAWLMLLSGGAVSALWALSVRRSDHLKSRAEALEIALAELRQSQQEIERQRRELARSTDEEIVGAEAAGDFRTGDREALAAGAVVTREDTIVSGSRTLTFSVAKGVLRDPSGEVFGTFGVAREISERKEREAALAASEADARRLASELERSNQDLERFAYVASHDLQEPLRMVKSYVQLLERRYAAALDADARDFIAFASEGVQRMERMIGDLLAFSRVERRGAAMQPVALDEPLAEALANLRLAVEESRARIERRPLPTVRADRAQMAMLFQNLVANALKFRRGDAPPRVTIGAMPAADGWDVTVADDGPGIAADQHERIFEVFYRIAARDVPGTGIGLALCRRIAERHGGRIWVESEVGRGSVFHVLLPGSAAAPEGVGETPGPTV